MLYSGQHWQDAPEVQGPREDFCIYGILLLFLANFRYSPEQRNEPK